jgi:hypothetical protein
MMEDPKIIRLNIEHYQDLLQLKCTPETRQQLVKLLARAQENLPLAVAEVADRRC